jgi:hypothetical protein
MSPTWSLSGPCFTAFFAEAGFILFSGWLDKKVKPIRIVDFFGSDQVIRIFQ